MGRPEPKPPVETTDEEAFLDKPISAEDRKIISDYCDHVIEGMNKLRACATPRELQKVTEDMEEQNDNFTEAETKLMCLTLGLDPGTATSKAEEEDTFLGV